MFKKVFGLLLTLAVVLFVAWLCIEAMRGKPLNLDGIMERLTGLFRDLGDRIEEMLRSKTGL